ncbi:MAG TPA: TIGR03557 family F420-dependent LLM class oxidoreductase [Thermomicrobiales bacterium]
MVNQQANIANRKVGFALSHEQFPVPTLIEFGIAAEEAGFDFLWTSDHFQPWMENQGHAGQAWVTMAALGARTRRIPFGTGVTCPSYRYHPAIVAQAFTSLAQLYPGRVFLGAGSGEALNEQAATGQWDEWATRSDRLVEAIDLIRQLWTGEEIAFKGQFFQTTARLYDTPPQPVPLYVASNGAKSMKHAGEAGDGLITDAESLADEDRMNTYREAARGAGKDPSAMPVIVEQFVVVGGKAEAEEAATFWRFIPKAWDAFVDVHDPREILRGAEAETPLEEAYGKWPVSDDPAVHVKALQELFAQGATQIVVHAGQQDQQRVIAFYGKEVLPQLRAAGTSAARP